MKALIGSCLIVLSALAASPANADCQCRANGRQFQQGQVACLTLPSGSQLARCGMELNNSSWKKMQDGCPSAAVSPDAVSWVAAAISAIQDHASTHDYGLPANYGWPATTE
jgi:hypothetical protein